MKKMIIIKIKIDLKFKIYFICRMVFTKEEKKEYYLKNKEKKSISDKKYRDANKEKIKQYKKEYEEANKEKIKQRRKEYYETNKDIILEKRKEYAKNYNKTDNRIKSSRIFSWKDKGVIHDDFNSLYDIYKNTNICNICNIKLIEGRYGANRKCLDHNHKTGEFRQILCNTCNSSTQRNIDQPKLTGAEIAWRYRLRWFILS